MPKLLLLPDDIRSLLARRFETQHRAWLIGLGGWPLRLGVGAPTEQQVRDEPGAVRRWVDAWRGWSTAGAIGWEERQWVRLGSQTVPVRVEFGSPGQVADAIGKGRRWNKASNRYEMLAQRWPTMGKKPALARHFDELADYSETEFQRAVSLLEWLDRNPTSGLYLRQLPIEGLHTKWVEERTSLVVDLVRALRDSPDVSDVYSICGLRRPPHRVRLRILCSTIRGSVGGLCDIEAPIEELAALSLEPSKLLIAENLESGVALPEVAGCVALMGLGHSVGLIERLNWIRAARVSVYWGDIDTHGFVALDRARRALPGLRSVLMDQSTLLKHRSLWGEEKSQHREADPLQLSPEERAVYDGLRANAWGERVRLEQERLPWTEVVAAIGAAFGS